MNMRAAVSGPCYPGPGVSTSCLYASCPPEKFMVHDIALIARCNICRNFIGGMLGGRPSLVGMLGFSQQRHLHLHVRSHVHMGLLLEYNLVMLLGLWILRPANTSRAH